MGTDARADPRSLALAQAIHTLLDRRGVAPRRHRSALEAALGLDYQQVRRRLVGEKAWGVAEIARLAAHFGEPVFKLLAILFDEEGQNATLQIGGDSIACTIWPAEPARKGMIRGPFVAIAAQPPGSWLVVPAADAGDRPAYELRRMAIEETPRRRIAVIHADASSADVLVQFLRKKGLDAVFFGVAPQARAALETSEFDGFILDWTMAGGADALGLLPDIRARSAGPILILTDPLAQHGEVESRLALAVSEHRAQLYEKRTSAFSLFSALELGFDAAANTIAKLA